jgi:Tol biopolymer transport system component
MRFPALSMLALVCLSCGSAGEHGTAVMTAKSSLRGKLAYDRGNRVLIRSFGAIRMGRSDVTEIRGTDPAWAPSGRAFVYLQDVDAQGDLGTIVVSNLDGRGREVVRKGVARSPAWSQHGARIAFARWDGSAYRIWTMNSDGTSARRMSAQPGINPAWSPDGGKIVFEKPLSVGSDLWIVSSDGSGEHALLADPVQDEMQPAWSPTGRRIVFVRGLYPEGALWLADPDGSRLRRLTSGPHDFWPAWSPDADYVVFARTGRLFTVRVADEQVHDLAIPGAHPDWSSDSTVVEP